MTVVHVPRLVGPPRVSRVDVDPLPALTRVQHEEGVPRLAPGVPRGVLALGEQLTLVVAEGAVSLDGEGGEQPEALVTRLADGGGVDDEGGTDGRVEGPELLEGDSPGEEASEGPGDRAGLPDKEPDEGEVKDRHGDDDSR